MKRFLCMLIACLMIVPVVFSEGIDLSALSFDELRELQTRISIELTTRPEWKSVPVPPGFYQIGVDIPAGEWCLKCGKSKYGSVHVRYGDEPNESMTDVGSLRFHSFIYQVADESNVDFVNITLTEGWYILIEDGTLLFTTPEKVKLGF